MPPLPVLPTVLTLLLPACIWVSPEEYQDQYDALVDGDGDGFVARAHGGDDCDDSDRRIHPGANETWYDGTDSDCGGEDDYDADGDGARSGSWGGDDCDDTDPSIFAAASETWYDGIDSDCAGDDDFDADKDGILAPEGGGEDCDDHDASAVPPYFETLGDREDGDCDGGVDTFRLGPLTLPGVAEEDLPSVIGTGLIGPVADLSDIQVSLSWAADSAIVPAAGNVIQYETINDATFSPLDPWAGSDYLFQLGFPNDPGVMSPSMDFVDEGRYVAFITSIYGNSDATPTHYYVDAYDITDARKEGHILLEGPVEPRGFTDSHMGISPDGWFTAVGCEDLVGLTWLMGGDMEDLVVQRTEVSDYTTWQGSGTWTGCEVDETRQELQLFDPVQGTLSVATWNTGGITASASEAGFALQDMEHSTDNDSDLFVLTDSTTGLWVTDATGTWNEPSRTDLREVDGTAASDGTVYVCATDDDGVAWLFTGDVSRGLEGAPLQDPGVERVDDCALVYIGHSRVLLLAVRGEDTLRVGLADAP